MVGVAEGVAAAVRRRQRDREPRVVLYDEAGGPQVVAPSAPGYDALIEIADAMLELAGAGAREPRARSRSRADTSAGADEPAA